MVGQPGFFDLSDRYAALSAAGDPLERPCGAAPFEVFRGPLIAALRRSVRGKGGRPPFDPVLMFKILVLQALYSLSDEGTEFQIKDRLSFQRFLGLGLDGTVPDAYPALLFRERLVPVYSPELLKEGEPDLTLADLARQPLLCEKSPESWLQLLNENRALKGKYDFSRGYSHWGVLAQAAVAGQGIALVAFGIAAQDLIKGSLRRIDCRSPPFGSGYRFLVNRSKENMPKVQRFRAWLVAEMKEMEKALERM